MKLENPRTQPNKINKKPEIWIVSGAYELRISKLSLKQFQTQITALVNSTDHL